MVVGCKATHVPGAHVGRLVQLPAEDNWPQGSRSGDGAKHTASHVDEVAVTMALVALGSSSL